MIMRAEQKAEDRKRRRILFTALDFVIIIASPPRIE